MTSKNSSIEANIAGAKSAARQMMAEWARWRSAKDEAAKRKSIARYTAAVTSCKVYIENYLKHLYPNEQMPKNVYQDVRNIVSDIDAIERINETKFQKMFRDIDQLNRDAA